MELSGVFENHLHRRYGLQGVGPYSERELAQQTKTQLQDTGSDDKDVGKESQEKKVITG